MTASDALFREFKNKRWRFLLLSLRGRVSRRDVWFGVLGLAAVALLIDRTLIVLAGTRTVAFAAAWHALWAAACLAAAYPLLIKRANDRGRDPVFVQAALALVASGFVITAIAVVLGTPTLLRIADTTTFAGLPAALYLLIDLGVLRGDDGANAHGPDPRTGV